MRFTAKVNPEKIAVETDKDKLSYGELEMGSSVIASHLSSLNLDKGHCIGLFMDKRIESILAIYGILQAAGVYVPLDIKNPATRLNYIVEQSSITTFITTPDNVEKLTSVLPGDADNYNIIVLCDDNWLPPSGKFSFTLLNPTQQKIRTTQFYNEQIDPEDLATILYTSGSTGTPKGVMISHACISCFIDWVINYFGFNENDRCISHAPLHFDLSLLDIFASHSAGSTIVLVPDSMSGNPRYLTKFIADKKITVWQSVPSVLILLLKYGGIEKYQYPELRHVLFAGEKMGVENLKGISQHFNCADFHNIYGSTETNDTFIYSIPSSIDVYPDPLPIGRPLPYVDYRIVDANNNQVSDNQEGHLLVKTPTMMRGYKGDSGNNELSLVDSNSLHDLKGFYPTKDIVRQSASGELIFCGRTDDIVKSNGYRINILEIEGVLQQHQDISDVAVIAIADDEIGNRIIAITTTPVNQKLTPIDLKQYCAQHLAKYAVPHVFEIVTTPLPKTSSGKVNKKAIIKSRNNHVKTA